MNAQALLLDKRVVANRIQLQARSQRNRPQRAMQGQRYIVGFGHVGDFTGFSNAAGVGGIGLDDVDVAFTEYALEVPAREQPLAQGNRGAGQRRQLFEGLVVFAEHRLFDKHQFVRVQFLHQHFGHWLVHPAMEVHADSHVGAHGVTHCGHVGQRQVDLFKAVDKLQLFGAVHLYRSKAAADRFFGRPGRIGRTIAADPRIHPDLVPHLAAQQVADRHPQRLALDVP